MSKILSRDSSFLKVRTTYYGGHPILIEFCSNIFAVNYPNKKILAENSNVFEVIESEVDEGFLNNLSRNLGQSLVNTGQRLVNGSEQGRIKELLEKSGLTDRVKEISNMSDTIRKSIKKITDNPNDQNNFEQAKQLSTQLMSILQNFIQLLNNWGSRLNATIAHVGNSSNGYHNGQNNGQNDVSSLLSNIPNVNLGPAN